MNVADSFGDIFDKYPLEQALNVWKVQESDPQSTFTQLNLLSAGSVFRSFHLSVYKDMPCMTTKLSKMLEDRDCDGVALTERDGQVWLILSELKSTLDSADILKAYKQIVFTYLKLHALMSLCEGFAVHEWRVIGIIACKPPKNKNVEDGFKWDYMNLETSSQMKPDYRFMLRLYMEKQLETTFGKIPFLKGKSFAQALKDLKITIYLKTAPSYEDAEADVDLATLFNRE